MYAYKVNPGIDFQFQICYNILMNDLSANIDYWGRCFQKICYLYGYVYSLSDKVDKAVIENEYDAEVFTRVHPNTSPEEYSKPEIPAKLRSFLIQRFYNIVSLFGLFNEEEFEDLLDEFGKFDEALVNEIEGFNGIPVYFLALQNSLHIYNQILECIGAVKAAVGEQQFKEPQVGVDLLDSLESCVGYCEGKVSFEEGLVDFEITQRGIN